MSLLSLMSLEFLIGYSMKDSKDPKLETMREVLKFIIIKMSREVVVPKKSVIKVFQKANFYR